MSYHQYQHSLVTVGEAPSVEAVEYYVGRMGIDPNANTVLTEFSKREDSWVYCQSLLEGMKSKNAKFLIYQILESFVYFGWKTIDVETRAVVREFLMTHYQMSCKTMAPSDFLTRKIQQVIVALILQEYPNDYPSILTDILSLAEMGISIENVIQTLQYFLEAVAGDLQSDKVPYHRINQINAALLECAKDIFPVINFVFETSLNKVQLVSSALILLKHFIQYIPPELTIQHNILQIIVQNLIHNPKLTSDALFFIGEVYSMGSLPEEIEALSPEIFMISIDVLSKMLSDDYNFQDLNDQNPFMLRVFASFLFTFLINQANHIEIESLAGALSKSIHWIIQITTVSDPTIQKMCIEFWGKIARRAWSEKPNFSAAIEQVYGPLFPELRRLVIQTMCKPEDIIMRVYEGNVIREKESNAFAIDLFRSQKALLLVLTNIDNLDMVEAIQEILTSLQQGFNPDQFNSLCYSVGAISGTLGFEPEKEFLVQVVQVLLEINSEAAGDTEVRALVSGGLMYVLSQYPRFVASSYPFFKAMIEKLFEFMHQPNDAVREMAVNSFGMISDKNWLQFTFTVKEQPVPYIVEIIQNLESIVCDLGCNVWIATFFGYLARIIGKQKNEKPKVEQMTLLMANMNQQWNSQLAQFVPEDPNFTQSIILILKCNALVAKNLKGCYGSQLEIIFTQMIEVYQRYCVLLNSLIASIDYNPEQNETVFVYREVKSSAISILKEFILKTPNVHANAATLIPPILETIVEDYQISSPYARVPEVLELMSAMSQYMKNDISTIIPGIYATIFSQTVIMIRDDFDNFLNFRLPFYEFLHWIVKNHIHIMLSAPSEDFNMFVETINWGVRHPIHEVCVEAINISIDLINSTKRNGSFQHNYILSIINHTLDILTDTLHRSAFEQQANLLQLIFAIQGRLTPIDNLVEFLMGQFPNGDPAVFSDCLTALVQLAPNTSNTSEFHSVLRELLLSTKQFSANDKSIDIEGANQEQSNLESIMNDVQGYQGPANPEYDVFLE